MKHPNLTRVYASLRRSFSACMSSRRHYSCKRDNKTYRTHQVNSLGHYSWENRCYRLNTTYIGPRTSTAWT